MLRELPIGISGMSNNRNNPRPLGAEEIMAANIEDAIIDKRSSNNMMNSNNNISKQIKDSMKPGLVAIGVIVLLGAALWLGYEVLIIREEMGRGLSWMSSFL